MTETHLPEGSRRKLGSSRSTSTLSPSFCNVSLGFLETAVTKHKLEKHLRSSNSRSYPVQECFQTFPRLIYMDNININASLLNIETNHSPQVDINIVPLWRQSAAGEMIHGTGKDSEVDAVNPRRKWPARGSQKLHLSSTRAGGVWGGACPFPVHFGGFCSDLMSSSQRMLSEYVHGD